MSSNNNNNGGGGKRPFDMQSAARVQINDDVVTSIEEELSRRGRAMSCPSMASLQDIEQHSQHILQDPSYNPNNINRPSVYKRSDSVSEVRYQKATHERLRVIRHLARKVHDTNIYELIEADSDDEADSSDDDDDELLTERSPLTKDRSLPGAGGLQRRKSLRRAVQESSRLAGVSKTIFAIFKSFVGTGVLFIPRGFYNAGWLAASISVLVIGLICTFSIRNLLKTKEVLVKQGYRVGSFGEVALYASGPGAKTLVEVCVLASQLGFCCAYNVFIAKNLSEFSLRFVGEGGSAVPEWLIMVLCVPFLTPLTWVRQLKYFAITNLIADAIIIFTIVAIFVVDFVTLSEHGPAPEVAAFNPSNFLMFFGTAVYAFEGIAMVIPIEQSMKDKHKLPKIMDICLIAFVIILIFFGLFNYVAFGEGVASIITLNLEGGLKDAVSVGYSLAVFCSFPLMIFPAIKIIERRFYKERRSGKKWQKNFTRFLIVLFCLFVAIVGKERVDQMVSLIGALSCAPLAMICPAVFHANVVGNDRDWYSKVFDTFTIGFGVGGLFLATGVSIYTIIYPEA
eukprot:Nk52_evm30s307 gene=Nk52_evmTU30s307